MTTPRPARKKVAREKPSKPHVDYPLFAHASGQWAKKVNQKMHYFGPWTDPQAALERWLDEKDDLLAGRTPSKGTLTVKTLVNAFLTSKKRKVQSGELKERTWESYDRRMPTVLDVFGKGRHVDTIRPIDFEKLRAKFAEKHGPSTLAGDVAIVRMLFDYAYKADLIDRPVKFGPEFNPPSRATMRRHRQQRGKRMFTAHQIRRLIKASGYSFVRWSTLASTADSGTTIAPYCHCQP